MKQLSFIEPLQHYIFVRGGKVKDSPISYLLGDGLPYIALWIEGLKASIFARLPADFLKLEHDNRQVFSELSYKYQSWYEHDSEFCYFRLDPPNDILSGWIKVIDTHRKFMFCKNYLLANSL